MKKTVFKIIITGIVLCALLITAVSCDTVENDKKDDSLKKVLENSSIHV